MMRADNYTRGNVYRDRKSILLFLENHFENTKDIIGAEAFLIAVAKQEDSEGAISSDLVYLGVTDKEIFLFGTDFYSQNFPNIYIKTKVYQSY